MAQAAATQQFIIEQTQMVWNATATAQSQAATATYSAYILNVTQTAQAQAILDVQATQTAQANATLTAYSLTATPWAALQADIVRTRNEAERRAWWEEFVVTPLKVILITLVIVLLIVGGVMAYRRLMPVLELRLRTICAGMNDKPLAPDGWDDRGSRSPSAPINAAGIAPAQSCRNFRVMKRHRWKSSARLSHPSSTGLPKPSRNCAPMEGYNHER